MSGRRGSIVWASAPDEGDAAAAAAEIGAWLAERRASRDWDGVLGPLRDALQRLSLHPLLRQDPICRDALRRIADDPTLDRLAWGVSVLAGRAEELAAAPASRVKVGL